MNFSTSAISLSPIIPRSKLTVSVLGVLVGVLVKIERGIIKSKEPFLAKVLKLATDVAEVSTCNLSSLLFQSKESAIDKFLVNKRSIKRTFIVVYTSCRVGTPLPYFIGELLYVDRDELENSLTIPLHVVTVPPALQLQSAESMTGESRTCICGPY